MKDKESSRTTEAAQNKSGAAKRDGGPKPARGSRTQTPSNPLVTANINVNELPRAAYVGNLDIGGTLIPCAVLEDETRVITQRGFFVALGRAKNPTRGQSITTNQPAFLAAANLQPYIPDDLRRQWAPILYRPKGGGGYGGKFAFGYRAELLPEVCKVFLAAEEDGALLKNQEHIAAAAGILVRGFAVVGIRALVDEATGFQEVRQKNDLQRLLEAYVSKEWLPWTRRFPPEFYEQLFKLRGWQYKPLSVKRPQFVGTLTNEIVYDRLPEGVLEELRRKNPTIKPGVRRYKHHQFLTPDIGNPHLERHLAAVIALMRASNTWQGFMRLLNRAIPPHKPVQQALPFEDDDKLEVE
jgi:hypothetical protein